MDIVTALQDNFLIPVYLMLLFWQLSLHDNGYFYSITFPRNIFVSSYCKTKLRAIVGLRIAWTMEHKVKKETGK